MPIRAVLWDVDDTLFDYTGCDGRAALGHLAAEGLLARYDSAEAALGRWQQIMQECYDRFLAGELSYREHRRARARAVLEKSVSDAEADEWFARYVDRYESAWRLFPDVVPTLDAVAGAYRQGVLSNSYAANQDRKLRRLGIRDRFEVLVCSAELGCAKPDPAAFEAACMALNLEPEEVVYVGDRPDTDARAATDAGLHGVWLDRAEPAAGAAARGPAGVLRIASLAELPPLLGRLGEALPAGTAVPAGVPAAVPAPAGGTTGRHRHR